jgi:hypothetical protein
VNFDLDVVAKKIDDGTNGFDSTDVSSQTGDQVIGSFGENTDRWVNEYPFPGGSERGGLLSPGGIAEHKSRYTFKIISPTTFPIDKCVQVIIKLDRAGFTKLFNVNLDSTDVPFTLSAMGKSDPLNGTEWPPKSAPTGLDFFKSTDCTGSPGKSVTMRFLKGSVEGSTVVSVKSTSPNTFTLFAFMKNNLTNNQPHFVHRYVYTSPTSFQALLNDSSGQCDPALFNQYKSNCAVTKGTVLKLKGRLLYQNIGAPIYQSQWVANRRLSFSVKENSTRCDDKSLCPVIPLVGSEAVTDDKGLFELVVNTTQLPNLQPMNAFLNSSYHLSFKVLGESTLTAAIGGTATQPMVHYKVGQMGLPASSVSICVNELVQENGKEFYRCNFKPLSQVLGVDYYDGNLTSLEFK